MKKNNLNKKNNPTKKKINKKKKTNLKLLFITVFLIVLFFSSVWIFQYNNYKNLSLDEENATIELAQEQEIQKELENKRNYIKSDEFIEDIARKELNMIKPNEMIIINNHEKNINE